MLSRLWIGFPGVRNLYVDTKNTSLCYLEAKLYSTLPCSGGHFRFCPLAANAQGEIQGTLSMLLRWVLIHQNDVFMFIVSQAMISCDIFTNFGGHFVFEFRVGKTQNTAWHGADLESAFPNCVRTTACQILLKSQKFRKWTLTNMW